MELLPGPHQTFFNDWENLKLFVAEIIENHKKDWNPNETRDFIDTYLKEIDKVKRPKLFLCLTLKWNCHKLGELKHISFMEIKV